MKKYAGLFLLLTLFYGENLFAKVVKYQFDINIKKVNFTGKVVEAMAIHDQIPGPTIEATVGDILEVTFNNKMHTETSIHWHGVLLPNDQDGVPYLTTQPIAPHSSFTYKYKVKHHGTYWYHSHTGLQEQRGVYGPLVFHPRKGERVKANKDYVVVLSDWTNENPKKVLSNLKKDGDYYALKKRSVLSWDKVFRHGKNAIKQRLQSSWSRMGPMDLSDVGYDAFLSNGQKETYFKAKQGDRVRIRLINSAASSYFYVEFAGHPMTIVSADGVDVKPFRVKRLLMAIAETYDVIVPIKENKLYELRATSEDGTGKSSAFIGSGKRVFAPDIPKPNLFVMDHKNHQNSLHHSIPPSSKEHKAGHSSSHFMDSKKHKGHTMKKIKSMPKKSHQARWGVIDSMINYEPLIAIRDTSFPSRKPRREVLLNLTGNMEQYVWSFNNKTLSESDKIMIKKGEVVRFILQNQTMMHHPIHLHGHFFRVLNKQGKRSPLKHTVNVPSMDRVVIEFDANEEKDWFFHCHNLYHMKTGMSRVISYEKSTKATPSILKKLSRDDWYFMSDLSALSQMTKGMIKTFNTRNAFEIEYDFNYKKAYDIEAIYARSFTQFFDLYAGIHLERGSQKSKKVATAGMRVVLPLLIESDLRVNSEGRIRLSLESDLQLMERVQFDWSYNTDQEYRFNLAYEMNKKLLLEASYDSDFEWGAGLRVRF